MTYLPLCQHRETKFIALRLGSRITRCNDCPAEFVMVGDTHGESERAIQRRAAKAKTWRETRDRARIRMFNPPSE